MSWRGNNGSDMYPMTSSGVHDDAVHMRLLSVSEDEGDERTYLEEIPELSLRNNSKRSSRPLNEKKSRCAVISILVIGLCLILIINIGVAIRLKQGGEFNIFNTGIVASSTSLKQCTEKKMDDQPKCNGDFPWQQYRLPQSVRPEFYSIFLWPNLTEGTFNGTVDISLSITNATDKIILHSKDLNLSEISVINDGAEVNLAHIQYCHELDLVAILLSKKLDSDTKTSLHFNFTGNLLSSLRGFYMSRYSLKSGENFTLGTTQFESVDARKAFPCFDEPNFKAKFSLSVVREKEYNTISNMDIAETSEFVSGLVLDKFNESLSMSTYLVAFIVSKFDNIYRVINASNGPLKVSVYAAQDRISSAEYALNISCDVILFYENLFRIPYPLPKLDLVAIPDFEAGAMENWGLVTYRETAVLVDEESSTEDREYVALVIAHEFAHQWFGNLVTMKWWNDLWLNEGFASFMEYFAINKLYSDWNFMSSFHRYHTRKAMSTDESQFTHSISVPVDSSMQIESLFDSISYSKGACIIKMMVDYIGEDSFMSGVTDYLKKFSYKNAENFDLVNAVSAKGGRSNLPRMLSSWTTQPGFPVVNISLHNNAANVSQMRYILLQNLSEDGDCMKKDEELIWQIPVSYYTSGSKSKQWYILKNKTSTFTLDRDSEWVILNVDRGGYYLVNYDEYLLSGITKQLKKDHAIFSEQDRVGLIYNAIKTAKLGFMSYESLFDLISYSNKEEEIGPLKLIGDFVYDIALKLRSRYENDALLKIHRYGQNLFKNLYHRYSWPDLNETFTDLSHSKMKLRSFIVGKMCSFDYEDCTKEAKRRFKLWKERGVPVNPDYKYIVYDTGIRLGSTADWDFMWNAYATDKSLSAQEKRRFLKALSCTGNQEKVLQLLSESIKNTYIRSQDATTVIANLQYSQVGTLMAWQFVRNKWTDLMSIFPLGSGASRSFLSIFYRFTDDIDIAAAEEFLRENNLTNILFAKRSLDRAKYYVRWIKTALPEIIHWLNVHVV